MQISPSVIAIDGPSASGKGTIARRLAAYFGFAHLDTGLLYRAVGVLADERGIALDDEAKLAAFMAEALDMILIKMESPAARGDRAAQLASRVAAVPAVRAALLKFQQDFCIQPPDGKPGAVVDGRDIGTVIAPKAPVKIYVTASVEARADRRFKELQGRGGSVTYTAVLADMKERDARDEKRAIAPAKPAPDAVILDTTNMTADEVFAAALGMAESKLGE